MFGNKFRDSIREAGENGLVWNESDFVAYIADPKKFLATFLNDSKAKSGMSFCQWRSKIRPLWRSKSRPVWGERLGACGPHIASPVQGALAVRPIL